MKPLGIRYIRFPSKTDCHPSKGYVNWWEAECDTPSKGRARREDKDKCKEGLKEYYKEEK